MKDLNYITKMSPDFNLKKSRHRYILWWKWIYIYVYIVYVFKYIYTERQVKVLEENKVLKKKPLLKK